jgi:hypothetical protein
MMRNDSRHLPALHLFGSPSHYNPLLSLFLNIILFLDGSQLQNHNLSALIRAYIMTYPRRDTTLAHQQKLRTNPAGRTGGRARSASIKSTAIQTLQTRGKCWRFLRISVASRRSSRSTRRSFRSIWRAPVQRKPLMLYGPLPSF